MRGPDWRDFLAFFAVIALLMFGGLIIYDKCTAKPAAVRRATVLEKDHRDAWEEIWTDSDRHFHTTHHDARFSLLLTPRQWIDVREELYKNVREGETVNVVESVGGLGLKHYDVNNLKISEGQ